MNTPSHLVLREPDHGPADVVSLTERHALADEVVSQICGKHLHAEAEAHLSAVDPHGAEDSGGNLNAVNRGVDGL